MGVLTVVMFGGKEYIPHMTIALFITLVALVTVIVAVIAAVEIIWEKSKPGWNKLNTKGYIVIVCGILMVILPLIQFFFQNRLDDQKDVNRKTEQRKSDSLQQSAYQRAIVQMRREYQLSVSQIRTDFGNSNNRT
jgi:drug/metabolite transporter (DMT)-like permease